MEQQPGHQRPLEGMRILVADDEIMIALNLEDSFRDEGATTVSASTVAQAIKGANDPSLTAAVLDVRLGFETTEKVADVLQSRGIPFLFYSGQSLPETMRAKFPAAPCLAKPVKQSAFLRALLALVPKR